MFSGRFGIFLSIRLTTGGLSDGRSTDCSTHSDPRKFALISAVLCSLFSFTSHLKEAGEEGIAVRCNKTHERAR